MINVAGARGGGFETAPPESRNSTQGERKELEADEPEEEEEEAPDADDTVIGQVEHYLNETLIGQGTRYRGVTTFETAFTRRPVCIVRSKRYEDHYFSYAFVLREFEINHLQGGEDAVLVLVAHNEDVLAVPDDEFAPLFKEQCGGSVWNRQRNLSIRTGAREDGYPVYLNGLEVASWGKYCL